DDSVAKVARPMFEQAIHTCAHVSCLKQRRGDLVNQSVGGPSARLQICSYDPLAGCVGERRATGQSLTKGSCLQLELFVRNHSVHDIPSLERRGVVLVGGVDNFARATRAGPLSQTLNAAQQRSRS